MQQTDGPTTRVVRETLYSGGRREATGPEDRLGVAPLLAARALAFGAAMDERMDKRTGEPLLADYHGQGDRGEMSVVWSCACVMITGTEDEAFIVYSHRDEVPPCNFEGVQETADYVVTLCSS